MLFQILHIPPVALECKMQQKGNFCSLNNIPFLLFLTMYVYALNIKVSAVKYMHDTETCIVFSLNCHRDIYMKNYLINQLFASTNKMTIFYLTPKKIKQIT